MRQKKVQIKHPKRPLGHLLVYLFNGNKNNERGLALGVVTLRGHQLNHLLSL